MFAKIIAWFGWNQDLLLSLGIATSQGVLQQEIEMEVEEEGFEQVLWYGMQASQVL